MGDLPPKTGTVELRSWRDFTKVMKIMNAGQWIYRGHEDADWYLESGLDRYLKTLESSDVWKVREKARDVMFLMNLPRAEFFAITNFKALSRKYRTYDSNVDALIAMQHYGAKTRLLDFTTSIMTALFFAYETRWSGKRRAIYAINCKALFGQGRIWSEYLSKVKRDGLLDHGQEMVWNHFESPIENCHFQEFAFHVGDQCIGFDKWEKDNGIIPLYTAFVNDRQMAQAGVELMPRTFDRFDRNLAEALSVGSVQEVNSPSYFVTDDISHLDYAEERLPAALVKLVFEPEMEIDAWQFLDQANINAATIYPDIVGVAKSVHYSEKIIGFDDMSRLVRSLKTAVDFWIPRANVFTCTMRDRISSVIGKMVKLAYSHVPVLDEKGKVIGVFSEGTILQTARTNMRCPKTATIGSLVDLLPIERHTSDVFVFVPRNVTAETLHRRLKDAMQNGERIGMFLVTEHGKSHEPLLGIITAWDIAGDVE